MTEVTEGRQARDDVVGFPAAVGALFVILLVLSALLG